jgi:hypothetical protein
MHPWSWMQICCLAKAPSIRQPHPLVAEDVVLCEYARERVSFRPLLPSAWRLSPLLMHRLLGLALAALSAVASGVPPPPCPALSPAFRARGV